MDYAVRVANWSGELDALVSDDAFAYTMDWSKSIEMIVIATDRADVLRILNETDTISEEDIWIEISGTWRKWKIPWKWSKTKMVFG